MRRLSACMLSTVIIASCGGGSAGPTSPGAPANVAGSWSGTVTKTVTAGPACLGRQPVTVPAMALITQAGASISGTFSGTSTPCSFHGTVSDTTISWTQDAQQPANPACLVVYLVPCLDRGSIQLLAVGTKTSSFAGTVSGAQISASGSSTDNIYEPTTHQVIGTVQATVQLTLHRP
ncbi:MAG TPA: hypothetical protein VMW75_12375 [Thermoanaerobaculia bacterium]|nr:hypothetical protein [Thermoanaerobaculia bacterium]